MQKQLARTLAAAALIGAVASAPALAQDANPAAANSTPAMACGLPIPPPASLPPAGSPPVLFQIVPCFAKQGGSPVVEPETYLFYMKLVPLVSRPSQGMWTPWNEVTERTAKEDFTRLWGTNFLDDLSIETQDYVFSNGVVGKLVTYHMEERERIKLVDYEGSKKVERTKIDEKLPEMTISLRLDSFRDDTAIRRVGGGF